MRVDFTVLLSSEDQLRFAKLDLRKPTYSIRCRTDQGDFSLMLSHEQAIDLLNLLQKEFSPHDTRS